MESIVRPSNSPWISALTGPTERCRKYAKNILSKQDTTTLELYAKDLSLRIENEMIQSSMPQGLLYTEMMRDVAMDIIEERKSNANNHEN
jgi:hypothetical protein